MKPIKRNKYGKYLWEQVHIDFLRKNWPEMTNQQLAHALDIKLTKCREKLYELGMKRMELEYWTGEQVDYLKKHYKNVGDTELAERFSQMWPKKKGWSKKHIEKKRRYLKLKRTKKEISQIKKRNIDNGMFAVCPVKAWETRGVTPIGKIKVWDVGGSPTAVIKLEDGFVHYNRWLFETTYFTLPSNVLVTTRSGNIAAIDENDLMIIDRAENARRNRQQLPMELLQTKKLLKDIEKHIINP